MIDRRTLLEAMAGLLLAPAALARAQTPPAAAPLAPALAKALAESSFVYVSPLLSNGEESRCHGEVWYGWIDDAVVIITATKSWKSRSLIVRRLNRARIWVGDYGRVKKMMGTNEAFRAGPSFEARTEVVRSAQMIERLLSIYDKKYPAEIKNWRGPMRAGLADGSRLMLRYVPDART
ncbi:MAG TPA: hypothetical protein VII72_07690 [Myxococcota bacterium]